MSKEKKKNKEKIKAIKKKRNRGNLIYSLIMCVIMIFFAFICFNLYNTKLEYDAKEKELLEQIEEQKKINNELVKQGEYQQSDEYVEKLARERLGMVKPNEIVFVDENK